MERFYTNERNHQILIALLKAHNIKYVVASPGTTNSVFVGSIQNDSYFTIYSSVDERSAAYIACGIAHEKGEPVILSCTGATASRNYMSGATEAYYSKLPILILTSSQANNRIGHLYAQVTDRTAPPPDVCRLNLTMPNVHTKDDEWECEIIANRALLELKRHGGGSVHLNLITTYSYNQETALTCRKIPPTRVINRISYGELMPPFPKGKTAIFVGSHQPFDEAQIRVIEQFCETNNGVVLCDHTSNYHGKYRIAFPIVINQSPLNKSNIPAYNMDVLVHIGEVSAEEGAIRMIRSKETWRVSPDGEIRDCFRNMSYVFEMSEQSFFEAYSSSNVLNYKDSSFNDNRQNNTSYYGECKEEYDKIIDKKNRQINSMPFSNVWVATQIAPNIPSGSTVILSILNTIRTWNYSDFKMNVKVFCPVGGFGIDGATSMMIGTSLADPDHLSYCITGDLAFFYDLNVLGNRHINKNIRILLVNNGCGFEFKKSYAMANKLLGEEVDTYVAAAGHFGGKSQTLVKHFAEDLGFEYLAASDKTSFAQVKDRFLVMDSDKPIILEVFVDNIDENAALDVIHNRE